MVYSCTDVVCSHYTRVTVYSNVAREYAMCSQRVFMKSAMDYGWACVCVCVLFTCGRIHPIAALVEHLDARAGPMIVQLFSETELPATGRMFDFWRARPPVTFLGARCDVDIIGV